MYYPTKPLRISFSSPLQCFTTHRDMRDSWMGLRRASRLPSCIYISVLGQYGWANKAFICTPTPSARRAVFPKCLTVDFHRARVSTLTTFTARTCMLHHHHCTTNIPQSRSRPKGRNRPLVWLPMSVTRVPTYTIYLSDRVFPPVLSLYLTIYQLNLKNNLGSNWCVSLQ